MGIFKILKNFIIDTSICFTVITPIYAAIQMLVNTSGSETAMKASWLLYLFLFSALVAVSTFIYRINSVNKALRVAIQCVIIMVSSYVCFFLPLGMDGGKIIIGLTVACIIYFLCYGAGALFSWCYRKLTQKEEAYEAKFKKKK